MRWIVSFGGGVLLLSLALLRLGWMHRAGIDIRGPSFELAMNIGFWFPSSKQDPWLMVFVGGTMVLWSISVWQYVRSRKKQRRFFGVGFQEDLWAPEPGVRVTSPSLRRASPEDQVHTLYLLGRTLEYQGRLRAAREAYAQAFELAQQNPALEQLARQIWTALRKVENRLRAQQRSWWHRWFSRFR